LAQSPILHRNLPIIEVADPLLLDELMLDKQAASAVLTRLSDRVAILVPERITSLTARLRKLNHLPTIVE
jgi:hypothetical protein